MNCADLEILLCDYIDGTLTSVSRADVERHIAECPNCAAMARDVSAAVGFMERAAEVQPPPELVTRITFELSQLRPHARPSGGFRKWLNTRLHPVLQPRFAMGFAMTILSFSLLGKFAGISPRQISVEDLRPAKIWQAVDEKVYRTWQRSVKYYENLRFVYEIQTQLREWRQREQEIKGRTTNEEQAAPRSGQNTKSNTERTSGNELRKEK